MLRLSYSLPAVSLGLVALILAPSTDEPTQRNQASLLGANPVINAADYPTIQAAIDALPPQGGIVQLPPGRIELKEPLLISKGDVQLRGAGPATLLKNINEDGKPSILIQHPKGSNTPQKERLWRIQLADFRVIGNEKSGHGVLADRINEVFLHGVTVSEHGGDGIRLDNCYEDPRVTSCLITYNDQVGLNLIGCHDIVVSANQFEENDDALHCIDGFNLCMTGNNLDDHLGEGVRIENTYGSVVSGNMIEECAEAAIILDRDCYGITLSANVIAHNGAGIDLRDAHGCAVSANTFTLLKTDALRVGPNSGRITVTGNNFSNSFIGDGKVKRATNDLAAAGLVLEATNSIAVSGNVFSSLTTKAIEVRGNESTNVLYNGNVFSDVETDAPITVPGESSTP